MNYKSKNKVRRISSLFLVATGRGKQERWALPAFFKHPGGGLFPRKFWCGNHLHSSGALSASTTIRKRNNTLELGGPYPCVEIGSQSPRRDWLNSLTALAILGQVWNRALHSQKGKAQGKSLLLASVYRTLSKRASKRHFVFFCLIFVF